MAYRIKNNSKAPRGIQGKDGLVWIQPGSTRTIDTDHIGPLRKRCYLEIEELPEVLPDVPSALFAKFDNDGDNKPGGSKRPEQTEDLKALRAEYQTKLGKRPFSGWGAEELKRRMGDV